MKIAFILAMPLMLAACEGTNDSHDHPHLTDGKGLYEFHCADCHGKEGQGSLMRGIPSNLFTQFDHDEVIELIINGRQHEQRIMPVMASMPRDEAAHIVGYLFQLRDQFEQGIDERSIIVKPLVAD